MKIKKRVLNLTRSIIKSNQSARWQTWRKLDKTLRLKSSTDMKIIKSLASVECRTEHFMLTSIAFIIIMVPSFLHFALNYQFVFAQKTEQVNQLHTKESCSQVSKIDIFVQRISLWQRVGFVSNKATILHSSTLLASLMSVLNNQMICIIVFWSYEFRFNFPK